MQDPTSRRFWQGQSAALAWRINLAAWIGRMAPASFFVVSPFAVTWYALRRANAPLGWTGIALASVLIVTALGCWWRSRRDFFAVADARVLLESHLRLDTRLTVAAANLISWPSPAAALPSVVRWRLGGPLAWVGAAIGLLVIARFAPVPHDDRTQFSGSAPALVQTESMLSALKQMNIAEPAAVEQLADRASELARRPAPEQFSHSALEAADALRNQTAAAAEELARALEAGANALQEDAGADLNASAGRLSAALQGMRDGALPANKQLLAKLPQDGNALKNLSPQQRSDLAKQLAQAAKGAHGVSGAAGANASMAQPDPNALPDWSQQKGAGGPGGGGDTAPLMLSSDKSDVGPGKSNALSPGSLQRVALGDKLGTTASAHDVDPTKMLAPVSAGAVASPASGGDAVWVNRLTPTERAALKNFFK